MVISIKERRYHKQLLDIGLRFEWGRGKCSVVCRSHCEVEEVGPDKTSSQFLWFSSLSNRTLDNGLDRAIFLFLERFLFAHFLNGQM